MTASEALKVVTGDVRFSFVNVFKTRVGGEGQEAKYSLCILIPKSDRKTLKAIKAAQTAAYEDGKARNKLPSNYKTTLRDGDEDMDLESYPEFEGYYYMTVSANADYPPKVVDRQLRPITDQTEVYSGCWGRVSMNAFSYNSNGNKGVSFGLRNVQKTRDDTPLGGTSRPEDDFEELDESDEDLL